MGGHDRGLVRGVRYRVDCAASGCEHSAGDLLAAKGAELDAVQSARAAEAAELREALRLLTLRVAGQSLRRRIRRTAWSLPLLSTSVARGRVGRMFCTRLRSLIVVQIRSAVRTASSSLSEA